ncbi:MAG: segregation/condensation protein A [Planctomycetes bacterium]|nr:segregation/condensation protein A [Planctomycetota bacterium]
MVRPDYTIHLERVFQGPMDLLLHLVREQEVEIQEIQIARILRGYMAYLESLEALDIEYAADFLVMAATLMSIKSRSLLSADEIDLEKELDPRDGLIQRLIEFRRFKHAADVLEESRRLRERQFERGAHPELGEDRLEREFDLGELTAFDLLATFSRLMRETLADRPHQITVDGRPLRFYVEQMVQRLKASPNLSLREIVKSFAHDSREALVGSFCALLELVRLEVVEVLQAEPRADIEIRVRAERVAELEDVVRQTRFDEEEPVPAEAIPEPVQQKLAMEDGLEEDGEPSHS